MTEKLAGPRQLEVVRGEPCAAMTRHNKPCRAARIPGSEWCAFHDPARARLQAEARQRGGRNRRVPKGPPPPPGSIRLRDVPAIQARLEAELADAMARENCDARTRSVVAVLTLALKCLEVGELETRLAALEQRLAEQSQTRVAR